nr:Os05g0332801 [Ipomoea batatas]
MPFSDILEAQGPRRALDFMNINNFLKILERRVPGRSVRKSAKQYAIITNPTIASQNVGLSMRPCKQSMSPETVPPGRRETVPFADVTTCATDSLVVLQADEGQEKSNTGGGSDSDGFRDEFGKLGAQTDGGDGEKDETFDENGGQRALIRDVAGAMESDDGVGEVGVGAHSGR